MLSDNPSSACNITLSNVLVFTNIDDSLSTNLITSSTFKNFVEEYGLEVDSLSQISSQTGISEKNLNRFLNYEGLEGYNKLFNN